MTNEEKSNLLKDYVNIANFMATISGHNAEVVLRDYEDETSTILHIVNGELSGRKVGEKISGYALRKIMKTDYRTTDFVTNYIIINESNHKIFRASTYYIKVDGELIGMLCVNYDLTKFLEFRDFYDHEVLYGFEESLSEPKEYFNESVDSIIESMIKNVFVYWDRRVPTSKINEPSNPIRQLYELNVFKYKGAINRVAELLDISTQTVYRYIKEIEESIK